MLEQITVTLMSGPKDGENLVFPVSGNPKTNPLVLTIGRRDGLDICLNYDSQVSRLHAHLGYNGEHFWIEDTDSRNGTFLDGERISRTERTYIDPGTIFRVGRTWIRLDPLPSDITAASEAIDPNEE